MPRIQERINTNVPGAVLAKGLSKLFQLALPWFGLMVLLAAGFVMHAAWHSHLDAYGIAGLGLLVGIFTRHLTHQRGVVGQWLAPVTVWLGTGWLFLVDQRGVPREAGLWFMVGGALCLLWNIWTGVHENAGRDAGMGFLAGAEKAGVEGLRLSNVKVYAHKITALVHKPAGQMITEDLQGKLKYIESGAHMPRGALNVSPHADDASVTHLVVSDPRVLLEPVPYPGPSIPHGGSMADPLAGGKFQDGDPMDYNATNTHVLANGTTGAGKALELSTPVPTPSGWSTMGELKDGDLVFDEAGKPCQVIQAWPVLHGRPCYEVEFSDGSVITADAEHLWAVDTRSSRCSERRALPVVLETQQLIPGLMDGEWRNYSVRVASPLQCPEADLPVPPYTLGAWLGDGTSKGGSITTVDREILAGIEADGFEVHVFPSTEVPGKVPLYQVTGLSKRLRLLGVRKPEGHKHIPVAYQRASEIQRRALLAGLLDTDGWCGPHGQVEFCNTSERLACDVLLLVSGLGYKATLRSKQAKLNGKVCGTVWTVAFTPADKVFRLIRKLARQVTSVRSTSRYRYITAIRPVPSVPVRCITVDSQSSLYLAGETCIPTHNTKSFAYNEIGETITRFDGGVLAIDITKRRQFLGPMEPALHRFETDKDGACELLQQVHQLVPMRADYLGARGYEKWEKGCGLIHWTVWLEEAVDIFKMLDLANLYDDLESDVRAARSAGFRFAVSLQRPTFDQIPPSLRSFLDYLCFGLKTGSDEAYALSDSQKAADCHPGEWKNNYPGKSYFDSYSMSPEHSVMENRWFTWGNTTEKILAHCARYPASARPADHMSAEVLRLPKLDVSHLGQPPITDPPRASLAGQPDPASRPADRQTATMTRPASNGQPPSNGGQPVSTAARTQPAGWDMSTGGWNPPAELPEDAPDGEFWDNRANDLTDEDLIAAARETDADGSQVLPPPPPDASYDFTPPERGERWAPEDARAAFQELLSEMRARDQNEFIIRDVIHLADRVGNTPQWLYKVCEEFCTKGILHRKPGKTYPQKYVINRAA